MTDPEFAELQHIIEEEKITTVYQPIVSLRDGAVIGYEALSRGPVGRVLEPPGRLFQVAEEAGMTWELEYTCRRLAIDRFAAFHSDRMLFLNVNPHVISDARFREGATKERLMERSIPASRVVLEITERSAVSNYHEFCSVIEHYKGQGFWLGIDDVGSGYSGLNLICTVKPKYLKLDMALIRDIHLDAFRQQLIKFTVDFARATDAIIVAEGIEQEVELLTLIDLGIEYGQGFLLGRPHPALTRTADERCSQLAALYAQRLASKLKNTTTLLAGDICRAKPPMLCNTPCHQIEMQFANDESLTGIPILDNGRPVGLVMREKFFTRLGQQYGYTLFHNRPISNIMDQRPLIVDLHTALEEVAQTAMQRKRASIYDHILVSNNGLYLGMLTVSDLLEHITELGVQRARYANPLTSLPGNTMIQREIERAILLGGEFSVLYVDLDNFKAYNDTHGFEQGDNVLKMTAELLQEAFNEADYPGAFVGHIGGDDFVVVVSRAIAEETLQQLTASFDRRIVSYYDDEHRQRGYITSVNRRGQLERFPFISVSIAVVTQDNGPFDSYHAVAKSATEVKKICKSIPGSCYVIDRRRIDPLQLLMELGEEVA